MIPEFFFTWTFWRVFFTVMGIIFCLLLLYGAFMWWITDDFDESVYKHGPNQEEIK